MSNSDRKLVFDTLRPVLDFEHPNAANAVRYVLPIISESMWNDLIAENPCYTHDVSWSQFNDE